MSVRSIRYFALLWIALISTPLFAQLPATRLGSIFPPGNSQRPAMALPGGRCAISTRPRSSKSAAATTRTTGFTTR